MTPEEFERERLKSAEALAQAIEGSHEAEAPRTAESVFGPAHRVTRDIESPPKEAPRDTEWSPPVPPDLRPVNASWPAGGPGPSGPLAAFAFEARNRSLEAQVKFNSDQVQLDNALVTWTAEHFAATHAHYDRVLARMQQHLDDVDTRHRELERELVRHVHEMARRIDVVLGEGEKGRVSHESALRSVRERLRTLEEKLR